MLMDQLMESFICVRFVAIQSIIAGLILGGIGGAAGIFLKEQIEMRNMQKSGITSRKEDDGYLVAQNVIPITNYNPANH